MSEKYSENPAGQETKAQAEAMHQAHDPRAYASAPYGAAGSAYAPPPPYPHYATHPGHPHMPPHVHPAYHPHTAAYAPYPPPYHPGYPHPPYAPHPHPGVYAASAPYPQGNPAAAPPQAGIGQWIQELSQGNPQLSGLSKMLNLEDSEFWKGALIGAGAVLLLTNETVQEMMFKNGTKAKDAVKSPGDGY